MTEKSTATGKPRNWFASTVRLNGAIMTKTSRRSALLAENANLSLHGEAKSSFVQPAIEEETSLQRSAGGNRSNTCTS